MHSNSKNYLQNATPYAFVLTEADGNIVVDWPRCNLCGHPIVEDTRIVKYAAPLHNEHKNVVWFQHMECHDKLAIKIRRRK